MSKIGEHPAFSQIDCCKMLQHWTVEGKIPRIISNPSGEVLWCNPEFEDLVGYTLAEFHRGLIDLKKLVSSQMEAETNAAMVRQIVANERRDYTLIETYQTRTRGQVRVQKCAQRWPTEDCEQILFLCEIIPLTGHHPAVYETAQHVLERLASDIKRMMEELGKVRRDVSQERARKTEMSDVVQWTVEQVQQHPKTAFSFAAVVLTLVLGEAGLDLAMRVLRAIYGAPDLPEGGGG